MTGSANIRAEDILAFWIDEVGPAGWYGGGAELDAAITARFAPIREAAMAGACGLWLTSAIGTLGYIVLTDQFPRNMFREDPRAFATDPQARAAAKIAIGRDWDLRVKEPERQFFYLPLMHSENLIDQDRCVRLFATRMPETGADNLLHARAHRAVIRRFGRFPYRNAALGRKTTADEAAWMEGGGYGAEVRQLEAGAAAG